MDPVTGRSRGFGFVRFTSEEERDRAITEMNGVYIGSKPVRVGLATARPHPGPRPGSASATAGPSPGELDPNNTTLFVGGLSAAVTEPELHAAFHAYGDIVYTKIPAGKGCGFVQFVQRLAAEQALEHMNGTVLGGAPIRVSWGKSSRPPPAAALAAASMAAAANAGLAAAQQQQAGGAVRQVLPAGYAGYYAAGAAAYGDPYGLAAAAAAAAAGGGPYGVFGSPGAYGDAAGAYGAHMGAYTLAFPPGHVPADPAAYAVSVVLRATRWGLTRPALPPLHHGRCAPLAHTPPAPQGAYGYASAPAQHGAGSATSPRNPAVPGAAQQAPPRAGGGASGGGGGGQSSGASSYEALMAMSMDKLNLAYMQQRHAMPAAMLGAHAPQYMRVPVAMPVHHL